MPNPTNAQLVDRSYSAYKGLARASRIPPTQFGGIADFRETSRVHVSSSSSFLFICVI